jgi:hypothetical protein
MSDIIPSDNDPLIVPAVAGVSAKEPKTEKPAEPLTDAQIEAEVEGEEAELDQQLGGEFADDFGASHQGGSGAQGGQTDFGNPKKFAGPGT